MAKAVPPIIPDRDMNERYIRWWTPHMSRDFEMLAFGGIPG
jgi:hypothetical protein